MIGQRFTKPSFRMREPSYDVIPLKASFKGIEGVRQFYQTIATAVPDLHIQVTAL